MNGDITLAALWQCQRASKVISPFVIFAVFNAFVSSWYFWGRVPTPVNQLAWNFVWPSRPTCPLVVPNFAWIGATSRPCGAIMLILGLWVNLIPAVCRFAGNQQKAKHNLLGRGNKHATTID